MAETNKDNSFSFESFVLSLTNKSGDQKEKECDLMTMDELNIIEFSESPIGLDVKLRPVQRFILKLFYGLPLDDKVYTDPERIIQFEHPVTGFVEGPFSERSLLQYYRSVGRCNGREGRRDYLTLVLCIGRRGGKSTLSTIMSCYEIYRLLRKGCPQDHYNLKKTAMIKVILVGVDKGQSSTLFNDIAMYAAKSPLLKKYLVNNINSEVTFGTPYDFSVVGDDKKNVMPTLSIEPQSCDAGSIRGGAAIQGIMDEAAHMKSGTTKKSSAHAVFQAIDPSVSTFYDGKMVIISTPNGSSDFFYEKFSKGMQTEKGTTLCIQAPTWEVNPGRVTQAKYVDTYMSDKSTFYQEYEVKFEASIRAFIENFAHFENCVYHVPTEEKPYGALPERAMVTNGDKNHVYMASIDQAFKNDSTVLSIGHYDEKRNTIVVDFVKRYVPGDPEWSLKTNPSVLSSEKIVKDISQIVKRFNLSKGFFDQHHGTSLQEEFLKNSISNFYIISLTENLKSEVYKRFETLYIESRLEIPGLNWLMSEFKNLEQTQIAKGKIRVEAPYRLHDDGADSVTRLVYCLYMEYILGQPVIGSGEVVTSTTVKDNHRILSVDKRSMSQRSSAYRNIRESSQNRLLDKYARKFTGNRGY